MSNQNFEVVFNADPSRPVGTIDGFVRKGGPDRLIPPGRMKDVLDDIVHVEIGRGEYVIDSKGGVTGAAVFPTIEGLARGGVGFEIGEGVFIGAGLQFDVGSASAQEREQGYAMADGSAIGHKFQAPQILAREEVGSVRNQLPVANPDEAKAMLEASFAMPSNRNFSIAPNFCIGKSAVLWCVVPSMINPVMRIMQGVHIGDEAQVFAQRIGHITRVAPQTIVNPSRQTIGNYRFLEPGVDRPLQEEDILLPDDK